MGYLKELKSFLLGFEKTILLFVYFNDYSEKNCSQIWEGFKNAFINKDPCSILPEDYELFINLTFHTIPPNKVIIFYVSCPVTYSRFYVARFKIDESFCS